MLNVLHIRMYDFYLFFFIFDCLIGFPKRKGPSCQERPAKVARTETAKQLRNPTSSMFLDS